MELRDYVENLANIKARKAEIKDEEKELNAEQTEAEEEIARILLIRGENSTTVQGIGSVSISIQHYPKVDDEFKFFKYLEESGQAGMIKKVVPHQTLRAWFKDQVFENPVIEIGLEDFTKTRINFRRK